VPGATEEDDGVTYSLYENLDPPLACQHNKKGKEMERHQDVRKGGNLKGVPAGCSVKGGV